MQTFLEKKDSSDHTPVTALAVSKDHKTVYVGDAKGHIHSWVVGEGGGGRSGLLEHWTGKDDAGDHCHDCHVRFSFAERRHHCRNCGQLFCSRCSSYEAEINRLKLTKAVKVCYSCHQSLKEEG